MMTKDNRLSETCLQRRRSLFDQYWSKALCLDMRTELLPRDKVVKFNPNVSVMVYESAELGTDLCPRSKNAREMDLHSARQDVLKLLWDKTRAVQVVKDLSFPSKFSNPALKITPDDDVIVNNSEAFRSLLHENIQEVLIVESRDIFLDLYVRSIATILPKVSVSTARTVEAAMDLLNQRKVGLESRTFPFDLVIVDYRLSSSQPVKDLRKGCHVLTYIHQLQIETVNKPLLIGTSISLKEDGPVMVASGADFIWGKPPPLMNTLLRAEILTALLNKRAGGHCNVAIV